MKERLEEIKYLKPCPFCGNQEIRVTSWGLWHCWCPICLSKTADCVLKKNAIEAWNRRVGEVEKDG